MVRRYAHFNKAHLREAADMLAENSPAIFTAPAGEARIGVASKLKSSLQMGP
jgi:hypothetical protein